MEETIKPTGIEVKPLNPWFSMWVKPRATMRHILRSKDKYYSYVLALAMLTGISDALSNASFKSLGDDNNLLRIVIIVLLLGSTGGFITFYFRSWLLRVTGSWIGGKSSRKEMHLMNAWVVVPLIWFFPLWIPQFIIFGNELFSSETPRIDSNGILSFSIIGFGIIEFIVAIWTIVIFFKCLSEVQGFSIWKAILNVLIATLVTTLALSILVAAVFFIISFIK